MNNAVIKKTTNVPATTESRADAWIDAEASELPIIKFAKSGEFVNASDSKPVSKNARYVALCRETAVGFIKFDGEGNPPERVQTLLFGDEPMPRREDLGDLDQSQWDEGLDGKPADPWRPQVLLPLQNDATAELVAFASTSKTGRRSVATLL